MPSGTIIMPSGTIIMPSGTIIMPSGTIIMPFGPNFYRSWLDSPRLPPVAPPRGATGSPAETDPARSDPLRILAGRRPGRRGKPGANLASFGKNSGQMVPDGIIMVPDGIIMVPDGINAL